MELGMALLGLAVGTLIGVTGVGSGSLTTPALILAGVRPTVAVASDLVFAACTKGVGAVQHIRQGTVNGPLVVYLSLGSIPGALAGGKLFTDLERRFGPDLEHGVTRLAAILLILVSVLTLAHLVRPLGPRGAPPPLPWTGRVKLLTVAVGAGVGLLVSFTSVGSGSMVAALLLYLYRLPAPQVVGSDVVQGFFLAAAGGLAHSAGGRVDGGLVVSLLSGSVPGVLLGSALCRRVPRRALRGLVAFMILGAGIKLL